MKIEAQKRIEACIHTIAAYTSSTIFRFIFNFYFYPITSPITHTSLHTHMNPSHIKVAAAVPNMRVADCTFNETEIIRTIIQASTQETDIIVMPELSITGYTCGDLFLQRVLTDTAQRSLSNILLSTASMPIIAIIGMPLPLGPTLLNTAVVISQGKIHGIVPKTFLPNYNEFYEQRWFTSALDITQRTATLCHQTAPLGTDLLFRTPISTFAIELCEDLWAPIPPSSHLAIEGAELIFNLSATNECIGKHRYLCTLIQQQSLRTQSAYIYSSSGFGESSTDLVFAGNAIICQQGSTIAKSQRFSMQPQTILADIDLPHIRQQRAIHTSFHTDRHNHCRTVFIP